ncbi:LysR family transcriptional regulator [Komagataeibacter intermedius AF2]|uniref:LysR family transcriptional regulator n=2 Tax=Komagataeibacter intermedius TaxID=66229 RepID=A0A0N1F7Y7_9PROT|nr:LysR family transcriptional regulator [Komagataeibacter intermedius AF2]
MLAYWNQQLSYSEPKYRTFTVTNFTWADKCAYGKKIINCWFIMNVFQAISIFVAVVETGSMTAAAERCGISSTMVGNYVRVLEEQLGSTLLRRTTRRQSLTPFGALYFDKCKEILRLVDETKELAQAAQDSPAGTLRITTPITYGIESVTPCIARYLARHPSVDIEVVLSARAMDLTRDKFDVAIRLGTPEPSSLICRRLGDYRMTLCAAPAYVACHEEIVNPHQLATHDGLAFAYSATSPQAWGRREWRLEGAEGQVIVPMKRRMLFNNTQAMHRATLAGLGVAMLPEDVVQADLHNGQLQALLPEYALPSRPIYLLYHRERYNAPTLRSFIDFMIRHLGTSAS